MAQLKYCSPQTHIIHIVFCTLIFHITQSLYLKHKDGVFPLFWVPWASICPHFLHSFLFSAFTWATLLIFPFTPPETNSNFSHFLHLLLPSTSVAMFSYLACLTCMNTSLPGHQVSSGLLVYNGSSCYAGAVIRSMPHILVSLSHTLHSPGFKTLIETTFPHLHNLVSILAVRSSLLSIPTLDLKP